MSDALKWDLAQELGVADIVSTEGWGGVSARNCGNLVKLAVARAEAALARQYGQRGTYASEGFRTGSREYGAGVSERFPYWATERGRGPEELRV